MSTTDTVFITSIWSLLKNFQLLRIIRKQTFRYLPILKRTSWTNLRLLVWLGIYEFLRSWGINVFQWKVELLLMFNTTRIESDEEYEVFLTQRQIAGSCHFTRISNWEWKQETALTDSLVPAEMRICCSNGLTLCFRCLLARRTS